VPADPVVAGAPFRGPGDHRDLAMAELDQVPGDGPNKPLDAPQTYCSNF
jgi:hypothetical protein